MRILRTKLGLHLLVSSEGQWQQRDPVTLRVRTEPVTEELTLLINDAISHKLDRYGKVVNRQDGKFITDTGVELRLNWNTLGLSQSGKDTRFINTLYKIHYLQWFGNRQVNTVFGVVGLICLFLLTVFGVISYIRAKRKFS